MFIGKPIKYRYRGRKEQCTLSQSTRRTSKHSLSRRPKTGPTRSSSTKNP
nr:MAG TPA: hypothetical protein [Caudoviricetes sp.]